MKSTPVLIVLFLASNLLLTGCGGGGAKTSVTATTTTMGQELQDLEDSYKKGLLSESEYKSARKSILNRYR